MMKRISIFCLILITLSCSNQSNTINKIQQPSSLIKYKKGTNGSEQSKKRFANLYPGEKTYPVSCKENCYPKTSLLVCKNGDEDCQYIGENPTIEAQFGFSIRWLGHASFYLESSSITKVVSKTQLLIDPVSKQFDWPVDWAFWLSKGFYRNEPEWLSTNERMNIDAVLYSHIHYDHFNKSDITLIGNKPEYFIPLGFSEHFPQKGYILNEMTWFSSKSIKETRINFVPAHHFSSRIWVPYLYEDNDMTLWGGWLLENKASGATLFFAGDTGYSKHFKDIQTHYGDIDICLLPIASYYHPEHGNWYRYVHTTPEDALTAAQELKCKVIIPWGYGNNSWKMGDHSSHSALRRLLHMYKKMNITIPLIILNEGEQINL